MSDKNDPTKLFTIKVKKSKLEYYKKIASSYDIPLAQLIKKLLDNQPLGKRRAEVKADPALIRQVAAIGNNLNQIARRLNKGEKIDIIPHLLSIEKQLSDLLDDD